MTTNSYISRMNVAIRNGELYAPAIDCLREVLAEAPRTKSGYSQSFEVAQTIRTNETCQSQTDCHINRESIANTKNQILLV